MNTRFSFTRRQFLKRLAVILGSTSLVSLPRLFLAPAAQGFLDGGAIQIVGVTITPTTLKPGELVNVIIQVKNNSSETIPTQGPDPGFVYEEGDSFRSRGFPEVTGALRAGIDFDGRAGVDHPYRWGFGAPLAPGQTATAVGAIHLRNARTVNYWAGLVREWVAWQQDYAGIQTIKVTPAGSPRIVAVSLAPVTLNVGDLLNVSITVRNDSSDALATEGPNPGFVYDEGDTFITRGFADTTGSYRVGVDFDNRSGIDHPYRWGWGAPLAPGETRAIAGAIRMKTAQSQNYWAGMVDEDVAWLQDREGVQHIAVTSPVSGNKPRVVHVHSNNATGWTGQQDYWNQVNQDTVSNMVDRGIMSLTGAATLADAWRAVLPRYQPGQGIAIKVNFSNSGYHGRIDATIPPVNAVLRGLKGIGVREADIWVYDALREMPDRFVKGCLYTGVQFFDSGKHGVAGFNSGDPNSYIHFSPPAGGPAMPQIKLTDVLLNATYVINMPLFKGHVDLAGVTLGFKHHLGSTNYPLGFHDRIYPGQGNFRNDYSPLIDLYRNPNVGGKTVLTIGDGLFSGDTWDSPPLGMRTFNGRGPNSLFFATDPVAIDCVMFDLLNAEWFPPAGTDNYLRLAGSAGLGVYEHGDPWGSGYRQIDYQKIEL